MMQEIAPKKIPNRRSFISFRRRFGGYFGNKTLPRSIRAAYSMSVVPENNLASENR